LTAIKNPQSVAFLQQTNIAQGPQQVNNIVARPGDLSRPEKTENSQKEVLEAHSGEWLERKTESTAGGAHPHVETLGAVHRPKDSGGQGGGFTKRK
jgi:hypothetical protein